mgnify:CR=1 FL=1
MANVPADLHYTAEHEWIAFDGDTAIEAASACAASSAWMREKTCPGLTIRRAVRARSLAKGPRPGP